MLTSPPCFCTISRNLPNALPLSSSSVSSACTACSSVQRSPCPASIIMCLAISTQCARNPGGPSPLSVSIASSSSSALPTALPSGWFISLMTATTLRPASAPMPTIMRASSRALSNSRMNAPSPTFTSSTMPRAPPAIFLLIMLLAISGKLETVLVTSRSAYNLPSAGASSPVCPASTMPISCVCRWNSPVDSSTR